MTYKFTVSNKTFTIVDHIDLDVKTNTRNNPQDYVIVLSSGGPIIINDNVSSANIHG